ncbi:phosphoglycerate dehydrogenase-like enzyme [Pullulanibacillus pueri]|uniref:2-hydroxyacid dehydrogenase n=1 Tax=Pullulanibacillus pueri TaxID=1437324 RepID=A0A8J3ENC2_9BACL|nr:D-2-hydroxyacid dehydrogenase [Pullulanibacillus pueri]MBM7680689.1 phosphoglycerate dehydrogenase-like enzyme [Pullulanibacillus pueri]GGH87511.1 2-hydroxyacid dehydrogenase [Pullulanibacillus pueri]
MRVLSTTRLQGDLEAQLQAKFPQVRFAFFSSIDRVTSHLSEADVLLTYGEDLTAEHIEQATDLKWIMVISAGLEKMPFEAIKKKGILVTNARGIHSIPMAEYTMATMLQFAKNMKQWHENQKAHCWDRSVEMTELAHKVITIIGPGAIGSEIARLAKAFRMTVYGISRSGQSVENVDQMFTMENIEKVLPLSDVVISVLPQTKETEQLITGKYFSLMPSTALFINIGRGKTVRQRDLLEALQSKTIAGAVLDVFEEEPLDPNHPFWEMDNVTLTPHFSSATAGYQPRSIDIFEKNLEVFLEGREEFINPIDLDRGY